MKLDADVSWIFGMDKFSASRLRKVEFQLKYSSWTCLLFCFLIRKDFSSLFQCEMINVLAKEDQAQQEGAEIVHQKYTDFQVQHTGLA